MLVEEGKDLLPAVERLLRPIGRTRGVEETMAGAVVAVELVVLAELLEHRLGAVDLVAVGFSSSLPNRPSSGQRSFSVRSIGATGRLALRRLGSSTTTLPPQQSTAASMSGSEQAAR